MPGRSGSVRLVLTTYRRALQLPGAWQFSASGFVARLPIAMDGLGIVLLISATTGSYALAGILSAAFQLCAAFGALVSSRWVDRLGQHRLLPGLAIVHGLGLVAFVACVELGAPLAVQILAVAAAGASQPAIGSMVRARWAHAAPDGDRLRSAFALESIIDELIFSIGPLLTAFLAFQIALPAPLIVAAVIAVAGSLALAFQRRTEPPSSASLSPGSPVDRPRRGALALPGMATMVVGALGVGGVFGTYEVSVVAFAEQAGRSEAAGLILGLWAVGSMLGGIYFGSRHWRLPLPRQVLLLTGLLTLILVPAPFVKSLPTLAVSTFVAGIAVAPALIAVFSLTERLVPPTLLTEGLTWTNSGLAVGFSAGAAVAGVVIDSHGTTWSFVLPCVCAATACVTAAIGQGALRRASEGRRQPLPVPTWNDDPVPGPGAGGIVDDPDASGGRWEES